MPDNESPATGPAGALTAAQSNALAELLRIAPVADRLGELFTAAGHELYLVGGSVRDALMGRLGNDLDFTTSARPAEIEKLLREFTRGVKGAAVWDIGKEFGTIGARMPAGSDHEPWLIEITTFRADSYRADSRKPEVVFGDTIDGDLVRRDFTVNAMAIALPGRQFVDPYRGLADLASGVLRTPATAEQSFSDDPLRMMRAVRFLSQLQRPDGSYFVPDPDVLAAMLAMNERIQIVSAERVRDELTKLLLTDQPRAGLNLLVESGLAAYVLPELPGLRLEVDEHHRHKDVYEHSLTVLQQSIDLEQARGHEPDLVGRLAALLHDIGKPATRKFTDGGKVTFHHHDVVGSKLARKRMQALRFSSEQIKAVAKLVELHLRFHGYGDGLFDEEKGWTDSAVRRYVRDAGDQLERLHILTRADCTTRNLRKANRLRRAYDDLERRIGELAEQEELESIRPDLNGDQIMTLLDLKPGPEVGKAYQFLLEQRMEHGPLGEERATELLKQWWSDRTAIE
ncbi:poly(A) polymerase [Propionibacteriaceae bacterium ES.041]|nr:CCA tRNA nucleotidyltransferase [Enemella evansiae]OYO02914.1 CCA tRNA nucleotidyltransferase [Enemella evansiae]PFG69346.1 poly(A) polymerase [Propionibacteriaceae bacterium ES.041]